MLALVDRDLAKVYIQRSQSGQGGAGNDRSRQVKSQVEGSGKRIQDPRLTDRDTKG